MGLRFWDMADVYRDSESLVGEWVKRSGKRDEVFIATKFGLQRQEDGRHTFRSDPAYVRLACEKSLERLGPGVDCIDLYYCHRVDGVTAIERTVEAMVELKNQGKINHIGLFEVSPNTLRRAHTIHPISAIQMEYSLFTLDIESPSSNILRTARELGVTVVAYSPIGRGILTGQFQSAADLPRGDLRGMYPKYAQANFGGIMRVVGGLMGVGRGHSHSGREGDGTRTVVTPAQVALAWLLAQGEDIIPIPGTKSVKMIDENVAAARIEWTGEEVKEIRELAEQAEIQGTRYPAAVMATLCLDTPPLE
ncbi:NADP-dependent oxidoreductase domain-containing protein [Aspergillus undulatus]|uniref:NADP-dependent oxidoreductase domain-containing protein n=1 Tax=Aspergillus undulatus TaxID=1810928 RepID=UPI003CCE195D